MKNIPKAIVKRILYEVYERRLAQKLLLGPAPRHLGVILDGNRRYAKSLGLPIVEGHKYGAKKVKQLFSWCIEFKIPVVTVWGFSTQNFSREPSEVKALMDIIVEQAKAMMLDEDFKKHDIRVKVIGRTEQMPEEVQRALAELETTTAERKGMLVQLALGYGGREEIVDAAKAYLTSAEQSGKSFGEAVNGLTEESLSANLYSCNVPDPDFIIRTSGEVRLSGFLLWQAAYSEYYFLDVNWPAFRRIDFLRALRSFQARQRRFGK
ncbi:MAG: polyprenyl diphosphate synthase [Patescibacteria group bacterium]|jgi:short-chain Z-isoprenyl diphosphate synthase